MRLLLVILAVVIASTSGRSLAKQLNSSLKKAVGGMALLIGGLTIFYGYENYVSSMETKYRAQRATGSFSGVVQGNGGDIAVMGFGACLMIFGAAILTSKSTAASQIKKADGEDVATQLEKLSGFKERGLLTEEEFQAKKTEILKRL